MSEGHYVEKCEHGTIGGQCRCIGPKAERRIPCPAHCPQRPDIPAPQRDDAQVTDDEWGFRAGERESLVTRARSILTAVRGTPRTFASDPLDDDPSQRRLILTIGEELYADLGEPVLITVAVWPDDELNTEADDELAPPSTDLDGALTAVGELIVDDLRTAAERSLVVTMPTLDAEPTAVLDLSGFRVTDGT